ncbi:MAG: epoxyqueuosine reductase [Turneriella sp.]
MREAVTVSQFAALKAYADEIGFTEVGALPLTAPDEAFKAFYDNFLATGRHADLRYLERKERFDLLTVLPTAQSILLFAYPYRFSSVEIKLRAAPYKIARYAWQRDYHLLLREKLQHIAAQFSLVGRAVTDSAPVPERYWARRAGLGKIGRNGMLISPERGSYFFIAALLIENPLAAQLRQPAAVPAPAEDIHSLCGECRLCVDACPTAALTGDGLMQVEKCISYTTIEDTRSASYAPETRRHRWIFGCDICQQVCPYNKTESSYAREELNTEHTAAVDIAAGVVPASRAPLKGSVFLRRGLQKLRDNISAVED